VARQRVAGPPGLVGGLRDRLAALLPAAAPRPGIMSEADV
jgi:hypothetical protein